MKFLQKSKFFRWKIKMGDFLFRFVENGRTYWMKVDDVESILPWNKAVKTKYKTVLIQTDFQILLD